MIPGALQLTEGFICMSKLQVDLAQNYTYYGEVPYLYLGVHVVYGWIFLAIESTGLATKVQYYYTLQVDLY